MTKKHFDALAAALNSTLFYAQREETREQWAHDVDAIVSVCTRFNPNFDRARFLAACGVEESK